MLLLVPALDTCICHSGPHMNGKLWNEPLEDEVVNIEGVYYEHVADEVHKHRL